MSLLLHQIVTLIFLAVIPLPILAYIKVRKKETLNSFSVWKKIVTIANIALFVSLITGYLLFPSFTSIRIWVSIGLVLILGAFLGIFSKRLKLYRIETDKEKKFTHLEKIFKVGIFYIITLIGTLFFMFHWYYFQ